VTAGKLWTDYLGTTCGYGSSIGVEIGVGGSLIAQSLNLSNTQTGLLNLGGAPGAATMIGSVFLNLIGQDCIALGGSSTSGGANIIDRISTNVSGSNCGRYAVNFRDTSGSNTYLDVGSMHLIGVNGGVAPYINNTGGAAMFAGYGENLTIRHLRTDFGSALAAVIQNFTFASGSDPMLSLMPLTLGSCTGVASCSLVTASDAYAGVVTLTGNGTGSSGVVPLTFPDVAAHGISCQFMAARGSAAWPPSSNIQEIGISSSEVQASWSSASALASGSTYNITYRCSPF
jgi:hypothetical protein